MRRWIGCMSICSGSRTGHTPWDYFSPRCQEAISRQESTELMRAVNGGRDFSGEPTYLISVNGDSAKAVTRYPDGKGKLQPYTWTFINEAWRLDNC